MSKRLRFAIVCLAGLGLVGLLEPFARAANQQPVPRRLPVLRLEPNRPVSTALNKGATFHRLELQADRVTTVFDDTTVVATRLRNGAIRAEVVGRLGTSLATLDVGLADRPIYSIVFVRAGRSPILIPGRSELEPTLEWANRQAYALLQADDASRIAWGNQDLVLPTNRLIEVHARIREIRTDWPGRLAAHARRSSRFIESTFTTDGRETGSVRWHTDARVLAWAFPGLTAATLDNASLAEIGGWPFDPDMGWLNMQAFAFQYFHSRLRTSPGASYEKGLLDRIASLVSETVYAQDGCTGLHWLDNSIYRPCCDQHDMCFEKYGCSASSWYWPFSQAWQCTACNGVVAWCFHEKTRTIYDY